MKESEIYGDWFFTMLENENINIDEFLDLGNLEQANMWYDYCPKNDDGFEFHSDMEWQLDNLYGDLIYKNHKHNRTSRVSKDGKMSFTHKKVINGIEMDFSFLDNIMDNYNSKIDDEFDFTQEEKDAANNYLKNS